MRKTRFFAKVFLIAASLGSLANCKTERITLRSLAPENTLVYIETNDLGEIADSLTSNKSWKSFATENPDFSAANGVQAAIAVTGFETIQSDVSLNVKPKFVIIVDTKSFESTTTSAVEQLIGKFSKDSKLVKNRIEGITFLNWTTKDTRKITAAITGSIAFIGNDEATVKEFLEVRSGKRPNLMANETLTGLSKQKPLAFGVVSKNGAAEIGNFLSIRFAIDASDEDFVRSLITKILPDLIDKSVDEITWVANEKSEKLEDKFQINLKPDFANDLADSLEKSDQSEGKSEPMIPASVSAATVYNFKSSNVAYQGFLRTLGLKTGVLSENMTGKLSNLLLQSYGIRDDMKFFEAIEGEIITAQIAGDEEGNIVIVKVRDEEKLKSAVIQDEDISLKIEGKTAILGDKEAVAKFVSAASKEIPTDYPSAISTIADETQEAKQIVKLFSEAKDETAGTRLFSATYTNAKRFGIERIRISEFGLFGEIANFAGSE